MRKFRPGGGAPVTDQTVLDVFAGERLLHQRVATQIDLADGEVVAARQYLSTPESASALTGPSSLVHGVPITG